MTFFLLTGSCPLALFVVSYLTEKICVTDFEGSLWPIAIKERTEALHPGAQEKRPAIDLYSEGGRASTHSLSEPQGDWSPTENLPELCELFTPKKPS